jgi:hypothetical protein
VAVALDFEYLNQLRPRGSDKSYSSSEYVFVVQSCLCGAVRYLNVSREDSDPNDFYRTGIIRGLRIKVRDVQRLRDLNPSLRSGSRPTIV